MEKGKEITKEIYDSLKIGDSITCKLKLKDITLGKVYTIKEFSEDRQNVLIIDDAGDRRKLSDYAIIEAFYLSNDKDIIEDKVNHPPHYTWLKEKCGIEVIDITRHLDFDSGNAVKYILRAGRKSEEGYSNKAKQIEDFKKAVFYLNDKIKMLEGEL